MSFAIGAYEINSRPVNPSPAGVVRDYGVMVAEGQTATTFPLPSLLFQQTMIGQRVCVPATPRTSTAGSASRVIAFPEVKRSC